MKKGIKILKYNGKILFLSFSLFLIINMSFGQQNSKDSINKLIKILDNLSTLKNKSYYSTYKTSVDEKVSELCITETRYDLKGLPSLKKGIYVIKLNDIDSNNIKLQIESDGNLKIIIPCKYNLAKVDFSLSDKKTKDENYSYKEIKLGSWSPSKLKNCQEIIKIVKFLVSIAPPKPISLETFKKDTLSFKILHEEKLLFDYNIQDYVKKNERYLKGEIIYCNNQIIFKISDNEILKYKIKEILNTPEEDRIYLKIEDVDYFGVFFTPDGDFVSILGIDSQIRFKIK